MKTQKSRKAFKEAETYFPGGVNSPVRAYKAVGGNPMFIDRGKGQHVFDIDGNKYVDFIGAWGPAILGHADPDVIKAVTKTLKKGFGFGAPSVLETRLAAAIKSFMAHIKMMRFVSSGTEAAMSAIRLARGATGRKKIIKFDGCYHGHSDSLLVAAGSGPATFGAPDSAGVAEESVKNTLSLPYNDIRAAESAFTMHKDEIAGVIVEPIAGNMGVVPAEKEFIGGLRNLASDNGSILIFDEVMTGFRVHPGGAAEIYGIKPDLTCLGKIIGGGMPVGAYGGVVRLMKHISPDGPVYQAGTLSGNPVAMAAGIATLKKYRKISAFSKIERLGRILDAAFAGIKGIKYNRAGGMFTVFFTEGEVKDFNDVKKCDLKKFAAYHAFMLGQGFMLPPSQFEAAFISTAHTGVNIKRFAELTAEFTGGIK